MSCEKYKVFNFVVVHDSLVINANEVYPITFFKHINPQELFDLMNDEY